MHVVASQVIAAVAGLLAAGASAGPSRCKPPVKVPKGFVSVDGTKFKLDGKDFYFAGSNAYYFPFNNVSAFLLHHSLPLSGMLWTNY